MEWIFETQAWISLYLNGTGNRARHRQYRVHYDSCRHASSRAAGKSQGHRTGACHALTHFAALSLTWIMRLSAPLFTVLGNEISGRDLILIIGGLFLIGKSTSKIHEKLEGETENVQVKRVAASFAGILVQIMLSICFFS